MPETSTNHLYYGDNLTILREHIRDESVDLIYLTHRLIARRPTTFCSSHQRGNARRHKLKPLRIPGTGMRLLNVHLRR